MIKEIVAKSIIKYIDLAEMIREIVAKSIKKYIDLATISLVSVARKQ
jgi:hypothetical protein